MRCKHACPLGRVGKRWRNLIERMFCRLKDWWQMAARYDRLAMNYLSAVALIAVMSFWAVE